MKNNIPAQIRNLRQEAQVAYVASVNEDGFPQIKGMLVLEHDSMKTHYFSTNTSSKRVKQFRNNPKASVYYVDDTKNLYKGALFTGTMEVCTDHETKAMLWREGFEMYYPKGVDDEDYCVYKFTAETVNYYHALSNITLSIDEL
ncbi:MAG: pyridoxamine 5'-phosphate oxidase family protein [Bacteroides sp.]|nr:pyridoxamine 5'-phosphate oxidase family protein [Bacteroides sp.]MCM1550127.1 pyridoxamine 5'-phosphate oxidase family protein [Clostridium sp.]